jgi:hypothetical protein
MNLKLSFVSELYIPAYVSYTESCVHNTLITGAMLMNGTVLFSATYSAAYVFAVADGSQLLTRGIENYNLQSAADCTAHSTSSTKTMEGYIVSMQQANVTLESNAVNYLAMSACLNSSAVDSYFSASCCNTSLTMRANGDLSSIKLYDITNLDLCPSNILSVQETLQSSFGYTLKCPLNEDTLTAYTRPGQLLTVSSLTALSNYSSLFEIDGVSPSESTAISSPDTQIMTSLGLVDSRFDCSNLPTCAVSCEGPNHQEMHAVVKRCTCMAEWFIHAHLLQILMAVVVFILQNVSRLLVCKGLVRIFHASLKSDDKYEYIANCDGSGKMLSRLVLSNSAPANTEKIVTAKTTWMGCCLQGPANTDNDSDTDDLDTEMGEYGLNILHFAPTDLLYSQALMIKVAAFRQPKLILARKTSAGSRTPGQNVKKTKTVRIALSSIQSSNSIKSTVLMADRSKAKSIYRKKSRRWLRSTNKWVISTL